MSLYSRHFVIVCKQLVRRLARFMILITAVALIAVAAHALTPGKPAVDHPSSILYMQQNDSGRKSKQVRHGFIDNSSHLSQSITIWRQLFPNPKIFRHNLVAAQAVKLAYLRDRVRHAEKKCSQGWHPRDPIFFGEKMLLFYDRRRRLAYCQAAKSGSTFWGRIFAFLTRRKEMVQLGIQSPSEIEKMKIHNGVLGPTLSQQWPVLREHILNNDTLKFIFTRNPYSRLWGVFLDKFYLLGEWEGKSRSDHWCSDFDSFENFLERALISEDHHVLPISEMCDPCQFQPHVIGHVETFEADAEFILQQALYRSLVSSHSFQKTAENEIKSTISSNFLILLAVRSEKNICMDEKSLSERLWRVLQFKGFLSSDAKFPSDLADYSKTAITPLFLEAARNSFNSEQKSRQQKHDHMIQAYKNIPSELIHRLQTRYRGDFEMFDYNPNPPS